MIATNKRETERSTTSTRILRPPAIGWIVVLLLSVGASVSAGAQAMTGRILFLAQRAGIYVMDGDGTNQVVLAAGDVSAPAWFPDGCRVAFKRGEDVYVIDSDGPMRGSWVAARMPIRNPTKGCP